LIGRTESKRFVVLLDRDLQRRRSASMKVIYSVVIYREVFICHEKL